MQYPQTEKICSLCFDHKGWIVGNIYVRTLDTSLLLAICMADMAYRRQSYPINAKGQGHGK